MADDISTADMARLLLGMSATSPQGLTDPGMAVMAPLARKPDKGQIPYNTTVENGPTPIERFVGSLGQFKDQALDLAPMTAIPRHAARTYHAYEQGDTTEAGLRALQMATLLAMPAAGAVRSATGAVPGAAMMGLMGTQPGAKLSGEVALRNFRSGAQMPEHASRMMDRMGAQKNFEPGLAEYFRRGSANANRESVDVTPQRGDLDVFKRFPDPSDIRAKLQLLNGGKVD